MNRIFDDQYRNGEAEGRVIRSLREQFIRFAGVGIVNTIATLVLYEFLIVFIDYSISFSIAFVAGIGFSFFLNSRYSFFAEITILRLLRYVISYGVVYLVGLLVLTVGVERLLIDAALAPIGVLIVTVPLAFLGARYALLPGRSDSLPHNG